PAPSGARSGSRSGCSPGSQRRVGARRARRGVASAPGEARAASSSAGTTRFTSPSSRARGAGICAPRRISVARGTPTIRGSQYAAPLIAQSTCLSRHVAELGVAGGDAEVRREGEIEHRAEGEAVQRGDDRDAKRPQTQGQAVMAVPNVVGRIRAAHIDERPMNLVQHPERESVQLLRAVERDRRTRTVAAQADMLVGHAVRRHSVVPRRAGSVVFVCHRPAVTFRYARFISRGAEAQRTNVRRSRTPPAPLAWKLLGAASGGRAMEPAVKIEESRTSGTSVEPETILPPQFFDHLRIDASLQPEKRLMLAVLEDAVGTFQKYTGAGNRRMRRLFLEAEEWFASNDTEWPFAFVNICHALGMDPEYM